MRVFSGVVARKRSLKDIPTGFLGVLRPHISGEMGPARTKVQMEGLIGRSPGISKTVLVELVHGPKRYAGEKVFSSGG